MELKRSEKKSSEQFPEFILKEPQKVCPKELLEEFTDDGIHDTRIVKSNLLVNIINLSREKGRLTFEKYLETILL